RLGDSGLGLYGSARTSLLFCKNRESVAHRREITFTSANDPSIQTQTVLGSSVAAHDQVVPVEELELGVEWSGRMGGFVPFVRLAAVGQSWIDTGSSTDAHGNLGFYGFTLTAG